jgi:hypothetical protein
VGPVRSGYEPAGYPPLIHASSLTDIQVVTATLSRIPGWTSYELDSEPDGQPLKPDSLYVEAMKP